MKNMKIEINESQAPEGVVAEVARLGFYCISIEKDDKWIAVNVKTMIATSFEADCVLPNHAWKLTTPAELKETKNEF